MPSARRPADARPRVTYLVGRLNRILRRRLGGLLVPFRLSVLHARGNLSNAELAKRAFITPQAMNEVMQGLEARKLVTRRASASHGRIVQLLLTQRGLDVMHQCDVEVQRLEQSMLAELTAAERKMLAAALATCAHALERPREETEAQAAIGSGRRAGEAETAPSGT